MGERGASPARCRRLHRSLLRPGHRWLMRSWMHCEATAVGLACLGPRAWLGGSATAHPQA
eukprot:6394917-Pyramimonas_sp.AAC.1